MPYLDENGEVLLTRSRVSLTGKPKVKTRKGDKHRLYGLWKLEEAREAGYAWLVEGESDSQTLWYHGEPAVGIPGANGWKAEWAADLEGIERLYFVVEDEAGEQCWRKLAATPEIRDRLYRVELEGAKDVSELHKRDADGFKEKLRKAREAPEAWLDIAETEEQERTREAWAACRELAESTDILSSFSEDLEGCRVVGERTNGELLYLALDQPPAREDRERRGQGTIFGGQVLSRHERGGLLSRDGLLPVHGDVGEDPLLHRGAPLAPPPRPHRGRGRGRRSRSTRSAPCSPKVGSSTSSWRRPPKASRPRVICKEGPTGFITTTTRDKLHAENETRYLSLVVTDTREQTRRVFRALAEESAEEPDRERWHALQTWLEGGEHRVTIPYAGALAEKMGDVAVRLRRDFSVVLSLIKSHAILHRATRERDERRPHRRHARRLLPRPRARLRPDSGGRRGDRTEDRPRDRRGRRQRHRRMGRGARDDQGRGRGARDRQGRGIQARQDRHRPRLPQEPRRPEGAPRPHRVGREHARRPGDTPRPRRAGGC